MTLLQFRWDVAAGAWLYHQRTLRQHRRPVSQHASPLLRYLQLHRQPQMSREKPCAQIRRCARRFVPILFVALFLSSPSSMLIRLVFDGLFHFVDPAPNGLSSLRLCQFVFQICDGFFSMAYLLLNFTFLLFGFPFGFQITGIRDLFLACPSCWSSYSTSTLREAWTVCLRDISFLVSRYCGV